VDRGFPLASPDADDFSRRIAELSQVLISEAALDGFLERVTKLSEELIPACDSSSISVSDHGQVYTRASSNPISERLDEHQYDTGQGPCLDAIKIGESVLSGAMAQEDRWPAFASRAASAGVVSTYSVPLKASAETVGALNLYALSKTFEEEDRALAEAFATQASVVVANAAAYHHARQLAQHLEEALKSRDVIGQAKGIIMERERVTAEQAFDMLRAVSQSTNAKLRDVAERVVLTGAWKEPSRDLER
jgi:GAF domain-containing protein